MIKSLVRRFKVYNPENENCPVCSVLNSIYRTDSFQKEMELPEEVGNGYYRRIIIKPSMEITLSDLTFYKRLTMAGGQDNPLYCLAFCLGGALQWRVEGDKKEYEIKGGESYIFNGNQGNSICSYNPGQRFWGLSIQLDSEIITNFIHHMGKENSPFRRLSYGDSFSIRKNFHLPSS